MIASTHPVRCAIYTRSTGNTGLDSSVGQRSLCVAFVHRKSNLGWITLAEHYHDREGELRERRHPALQRLLEQVERRHIDRIVVDRISRVCTSAADLDRLMLILDYGGCALVIAGQGIDGATPIGRQVLVSIRALAPLMDKRQSGPAPTALNHHRVREALMHLLTVQGGQTFSRIHRTLGNEDSDPSF